MKYGRKGEGEGRWAISLEAVLPGLEDIDSDDGVLGEAREINRLEVIANVSDAACSEGLHVGAVLVLGEISDAEDGEDVVGIDVGGNVALADVLETGKLEAGAVGGEVAADDRGDGAIAIVDVAEHGG